MVPFAYWAAPDARAAIAAARARHGAEFIAGGTDMLQLLEHDVRRPDELVDIGALPFGGISADDNGLRLGALAHLADVADDPAVREGWPVLAEALLATASPQVRNAATIGGNLLQRTRCLYFRDTATPCNKREPGSGCPAQDGRNRLNAIFGGSPHCIATHPSDLAVALVCLGAEVEIEGENGARRLALDDLYRLPGDTPDRETVLEPGDLIRAVAVPARFGRRSCYVKVRDRASFEWAVVSAAVALIFDGPRIGEARVAAGGVGTKPWRLTAVEEALRGREPSAETFRTASRLATEGAEPRGDNAFKVPLLQRTVERALRRTGGLA